MSRVLVAYTTNSGSTAEVAETIASELTRAGHKVEVSLISTVKDLAQFDSVVLGAPMIFGWQHTARHFLRSHQEELTSKKVAIFACAMRLTRPPNFSFPSFVLDMDPNLVSDPEKPESLTFKERFTAISGYLKPMLRAAPMVKPVAMAFFKGSLEMFKLKWWQAAFVMVVVQAPPGDYRDFDFIRSWGTSLAEKL